MLSWYYDLQIGNIRGGVTRVSPERVGCGRVCLASLIEVML
jgi:hypothetical protein